MPLPKLLIQSIRVTILWSIITGVVYEAIITGFAQAGSDGRPVETITFNFTQISFTGTQMDADGTAASPASYGWDISSNTST